MVHTIYISVDPHGNISVDKPHVYMRITDEIEWDSDPDVHFVVHFPHPNRQPFRNAVFHKGLRSGAPIVSSGPTKYKYNVHVGGGPPLDPDVEVGDPPGGKGN